MSIHGGSPRKSKSRVLPSENPGGGVGAPPNALQAEDGSYILDENGNYILAE